MVETELQTLLLETFLSWWMRVLIPQEQDILVVVVVDTEVAVETELQVREVEARMELMAHQKLVLVGTMVVVVLLLSHSQQVIS
jgi:hypothetical protein